jgi:hypothetical protein
MASLPFLRVFNNGVGNTAFGERSAYLSKKIGQERVGIFKSVWPAAVFFGAMPVVRRFRPPLEFRSFGPHRMSVVEPDEALPVRAV